MPGAATQRPDDREAGGDRRHLRLDQADRAGGERGDQQRPEPVSTVRAGSTSGSDACIRALASSEAIGDDVSW